MLLTCFAATWCNISFFHLATIIPETPNDNAFNIIAFWVWPTEIACLFCKLKKRVLLTNMSDIDVNCKQIIFRFIATFSRVCFVKASLMVEFCAWLKKLDQISSNKLYQRRWHLCNVEFLLPMAVQCIDSLFAKLIFKLIKWNVLLPSIKVLWMEWSWRGSTRNCQFLC